MDYPVEDVTPPAILNGQTNGKLDPAILVRIPGLAGGPDVYLVQTAAWSWAALCAAALADGIVLQASSLTDSYRPYSVQERIFLERYTTTVLSGRPYKVWQGKRWYKRPGTATAAIPGRSNHGWAIAIDVRNAKGAILAWLRKYAMIFGWSWETVPEEPWHLRNWPGDALTPAVRDFMEGRDDMSAKAEDQINTLFELLVNGKRTQGSFTHTLNGVSQPINPLFNEVFWVRHGLAQLGAEMPDPIDLAQVAEAAREGAEAGVLASVDELVAAFVAALPDDVASREDVVSALREVLTMGVGAAA